MQQFVSRTFQPQHDNNITPFLSLSAPPSMPTISNSIQIWFKLPTQNEAAKFKFSSISIKILWQSEKICQDKRKI